VVFAKEYIMRCLSAEWSTRNEMIPLWCRLVNWGNCGISWVNCAVLCVKDDWKGQFWGLCYCLLKLRSLRSFFPSDMTSRSNIAEFNWECIGLFNLLFPPWSQSSCWHISVNVMFQYFLCDSVLCKTVTCVVDILTALHTSLVARFMLSSNDECKKRN
jgi:hypothetical protein